MEYMRGLLRDNDLFRAYVTVRAGLAGWWAGVEVGGPTWTAGVQDLAVGGALCGTCPEPRLCVPPLSPASVGREAPAVPAAEAERHAGKAPPAAHQIPTPAQVSVEKDRGATRQGGHHHHGNRDSLVGVSLRLSAPP